MGDGPPMLQDAIRYFADYPRCHDLVLRWRWPDGKVSCPECGSEKVRYLARNRVWQCYSGHPKARFSLKTGTLFEDSPIHLEKWLPAVWLLLNDMNGSNGVSSRELSRSLGVSQKTAWFMLHRIRLAMQSKKFGPLKYEPRAV